MCVTIVPPVCSTKPMWVLLQKGKELIIPLDCNIGAPEPIYQWYRNGIKLTNQTKRSYYEESASLSSAGTYSCELKNIAGSYLWMEATIAT